MAKGKVIQGKALVQLEYGIYSTVAGLFADMLNPKMRGPNFKFTASKIAQLSFSFGFYPTRYSELDKVKRFEYDSLLLIKEHWLEFAEQVAERLIKGSGINENGTWDD
jgi:hypothetical protein